MILVRRAFALLPVYPFRVIMIHCGTLGERPFSGRAKPNQRGIVSAIDATIRQAYSQSLSA